MRPPRRLIALTDEVQDLLTSWCITTPGIDHPENQEGLIDGDRTTNGPGRLKHRPKRQELGEPEIDSDRGDKPPKTSFFFQRRDMAPPNKNETFPVDILVDTGADRGSYMSLAFYHMIAKWGILVTLKI